MISICSRNLSEFVNRIDASAIKYKVQKFSVITGLALATLASLGLAHTFPFHYALTLGAVGYLSAETLPLVIDAGNAKLIKSALACYFISFNCLVLGGVSELFIKIPVILKLLIENNSPNHALSLLLMLTATFGSILPVFIASLEKLMEIWKHPQWEVNIDQMQKEWRLLSNKVHSNAQSFLSKMLAFFYLLAPRNVLNVILRYSAMFDWPISGQGLLLNAFFSSSNFEDILNEIGEFSYFSETFDTNRLIVFFHINYAMHLIPENSAEKEIDFLLDQAKWLVDMSENQNRYAFFLFDGGEEEKCTSWMSPVEFMHLFRGRFLEIIRSKVVKQENSENEIIRLQLQVEELISELNLISSKEIFAEKQGRMFEEFGRLRQEVQILQFEKNRLKIYSEISSLAEQSLEYGESGKLIDSSFTEEYLLIDGKQLERGFSKLKNLQSSVNNLSQKIENLNTKYRSEGIEVAGPVQFLGANKCAFKYEDYLMLKDLFGLDELDEDQLDEKFREVGLACEEDFYDHAILPKASEIDKSTIHANLKKFINDKNQVFRKKVDVHNLSNKCQKNRNRLGEIQRKISRWIYIMITKGLILVPCLIHPIPFLLGFSAGGLGVALVRFGILNPIDFFSLSLGTRLVLSAAGRRRLLYNTRTIQENSQIFCNNNIIGKISLISREILATLLFTSGVGSVVQGLAFTDEVTNLLGL